MEFCLNVHRDGEVCFMYRHTGNPDQEFLAGNIDDDGNVSLVQALEETGMFNTVAFEKNVVNEVVENWENFFREEGGKFNRLLEKQGYNLNKEGEIV